VSEKSVNEKKERLIFDVAYQPQERAHLGTSNTMLNVMIALLPAVAVSVWQFGLKSLLLIVVSMGSAVFFEWGYRRIMKKHDTIGDLSAALTGMLLALTLPATAPWWLPVIGTFFAIVIVKQLYGGLGKNFMNPALAARAFLIASYSLYMTRWGIPSSLAGQVDAVTMATPMAYLYTGESVPAYLNFRNMFLGMMPGCLGEISKVALLVGAAYLLIRKVINWRIPFTFIGTVCLLNLVFGHEGYTNVEWMLYNLLSGSLIFGAFFMATDYVTTPVTPLGHLLFGFGCGCFTVLIRYFGSYPEGVSYSILIMNLCTWSIDKLFRRYQFGVSRADKLFEKAKKLAEKEARSRG
jgi:electron transport complex protein RnfD